jgi:hypothetical protein
MESFYQNHKCSEVGIVQTRTWPENTLLKVKLFDTAITKQLRLETPMQNQDKKSDNKYTIQSKKKATISRPILKDKRNKAQ